mgnify:FL=1
MIEREPSEPIPIRTRRFTAGRRIAVVVVLALVALLFSLRGLANFWTDYLWFDSVGFGPVWTTILVTKLVLAIVAIAVAFGLVLGNLWLAGRVRPMLGEAGPGEQVVSRYRTWAGGHHWRVPLIVSGALGLILGLGAAGWWENWLQLVNSRPFGVTDPVFQKDIGYYIFQIPFWRDLLGWAFQFVLVVTIVVAVFYYLSGAIRVHPRAWRRY